MARSLRICLAEYPRIMLEAIAEGWGIALTNKQLPEVVDRLALEMTNSDNLQLLLQRLSAPERQALALVAATGQVKAHVLTRRYGELRHFGPGKLEWAHAWREPATLVERLWFLGLLYAGYGTDERFRGQVFFIPPEILAALPPMSAALPVFHVESAPIPAIVHDDSEALAQDASTILSYLRNNQVHARTGILSSQDLPRLRPRWSGPATVGRLSFVQHLCKASGLVSKAPGVWKPTAAAADWLKASPCDRRRSLYQAWQHDAEWNELWLVPGIRCEKTGWHNDPVSARQGVLRSLAQCAVGTWCTIESFITAIHEVSPDFLRPDGDYDSWYIRHAKTGHYLTGYQNWDKVEGALIHYLLESNLRWLGIVALGGTRQEDPLDRFMLTPGGAATLGLSEGPQPVLRPFLLQPEMQVLVPRESNWYDRYLLERFARWLGEQSAGTTYVLDKPSVQGGLQSSISLDQILAFLRRTTGRTPPSPIVRTLRAWSR
jgi:hypothetical protein